MSSDDEPGTSNFVSEYETQFVPRSDDDEVLWAVQEITAERSKQYKVKWAGTDPATGRPWAQSWVTKHDCTDDLVAEWKAKKSRKKRGGRASIASRASGSSKRGGSSTSRKKTRSPTPEATTSRLDSVQEHPSPPPKRSTIKRKRQSETPATTSGGAGQADEQNELSRPRKKPKIALGVLLPPISSDEEEDAPPVLASRVKVTVQNKASLKSTGAALDNSDEDDSSPPKAKGKSVDRLDVRSKSAAVTSRASDLREESRLQESKTETEGVPRRKERVADAALTVLSQDEVPRQLKSKKKSTSKRIASSGQDGGPSENEVVSAVIPVKIGPPRGAKRLETLRTPGPPSKPGPSRTKSRGDDSADERVLAEEPDDPGDDAPVFMVDSPTSALPPPHISIPQAVPSVRPPSPILSPGARARLEQFDQIMTYDAFDASDPPHPLSPPPSKPKHSKLGMSNGLIVPESESSGNSQSQSQPLSKLPPSPQPPPVRESPRKPSDLPTIAVIPVSAPSSPASSQDLFPLPPRLPPSANRPSKRSTVKPVPQISPNTFRSTINARSHVAGSEAPPSSIESFTSPKRVDKGKQRAVEDDQLQSSLSEREGDGERRGKLAQKGISDSELKKRGKVLFDQVQRAREAEQQKKKKVKRLKTVNEIINQTVSSPSKGSPPPFTGGAESAPELLLEDVIDLTGGANSTTLDTAEHGEPKPLSEEERARLRIELRQEEEENTQEAMGIYPPLPVKKPTIMNGRDAQIPPPRSPEHSPFNRQFEDVDHVEQRSADLQLASVIVQPSQEKRYEDTDIEPLPANQQASSPPRLIPENLSDSPKGRLGEALSLLNVKSEEIQRLERELADERKNLQCLKAELANTKQSSERTGSVLAACEAERAQWTKERSKWENDFAMWETQRKEWCDDKANLSARVAELLDAAARGEEVSAKLAELGAERDAWIKERGAMLNDMTQLSEELTVLIKARGENDQDRVKWEAERASWVEEKARWETERAALQEKQEVSSCSVDELTASLEPLTSAKVSAEKDRDFFREQYMEASEFVSSVREENMELEKRVKIAEGQAQEGVAAIKALYEGHIKALQADVDRWKGLTELLQEKDRRTNDELRLRAAQVPELGDLCSRLTAENKSLEADARKLGQAQQRGVIQRNKLYREIFVLKKEKASLRSKLAKMADSSTQESVHPAPAPPILEDPENLDPNDMEIFPDPMPQSSDVSFDEPALFPCMWRPQFRDQCQHVFDSKEDLERHMQTHLRDLLSE